jgi:presenilin enhancer 2
MSGTEILSVGRKMFYGGFAFLPFLWLVNVIYLWPTLKRTDVPVQLRKCNTVVSFFVCKI